jgi:hypothetical protein
MNKPQICKVHHGVDLGEFIIIFLTIVYYVIPHSGNIKIFHGLPCATPKYYQVMNCANLKVHNFLISYPNKNLQIKFMAFLNKISNGISSSSIIISFTPQNVE